MSSLSPSWGLLTYLKVFWDQHICPKAELNEDNLPNQAGKVFIVTGGNSGLGAELVKMLYNVGSTVYILTRDEAKSRRMMTDLESQTNTATPGTLKFIHMDLDDLNSVKQAAKDFLVLESRLDVLWNNAGTGRTDTKLFTNQDIEMHHGVNCVGPFLLAKLLYPVLEKTAKRNGVDPASVRIVWTSSVIVDFGSPTGGVDLEDLDSWKAPLAVQYASSRAGNWFLASELHRRFGNQGVLNITQNPGTVTTPAYRYTPFYQYALLWLLFFGEAIDGARTSLWSGLQPMTMKDGGRYVIPWGRWHPRPRPDVAASLESKDQGGTGIAEAFYDWCDEKVAPFVSSS
jgi:NAD(P)-dependent dehydrogenase (short-subunit alcohol dehydrogenase family)